MSLRATRHSCHAICSMPPTRTFTSTCRLRPVFVLLSYFLDGPVDSPVLCVSEPRRRAITTLIRHINDPRNRRQKKTQLGEARSQERQKRFVAVTTEQNTLIHTFRQEREFSSQEYGHGKETGRIVPIFMCHQGMRLAAASRV